MKVFKLFFYLVFIGMLVMAGMMNSYSFLLKTQHAPYGIISLELSTATAHHQKIFKEWDSVYFKQQVYSRDTVITAETTGLDAAIKQTRADNSFIFFYTLFLALLFYQYRHLLNHPHQKTNRKLWLYLSFMVLLAALFDFFENRQLLKAIDTYKVQREFYTRSALWVFLPALFKFLLLFLSIIYFLVKIKALRRLSDWLQSLSRLLKAFVTYAWKFRIVLIGLLTLFLLLAFTNQGQDLLVTINTSAIGIILFFTVTTVLAFINWYLPKIYDNLEAANNENTDQNRVQRFIAKNEKLDFARFLGLFTFLVPAVGILITMQAYHITYFLAAISPLVILLIASILYFNILRYHWLDYIYKPKGVFSGRNFIITLLLVFGLIIYWGFSPQTRAPFYLAYLSLGFFLLSFAFLVTVTYHTELKPFKKIPIAPFIITAGILVSLLFVAFNFDAILFRVTENHRFYTLPIVIAALIAYTLFFSLLLILGRKTKIQFITLFLLLVIYRSATSINTFHQVHLVPKPVENMQMKALKDYSEQWLASRRNEIAAFNQQYPTAAYPVFFVNAYGGGIKAAAWTTMVIGRLDQLLKENVQQHESRPDFQHYIFSGSGVSGGAVGLSLLSAARIQKEKNTPVDTLFYPVNSLKIYHHDYLTATLVGLFGRDALMALVGLNLYPDRARLQEKNWELYTSKYGLKYAALLSEGWKSPTMEVPLFFSNTYDINTGFKGLIAPVTLNKKDFPGTILLQHLIDKNQDLYLSTMAFLSSRFPYVSPTAKFDEHHHFTDGGTLENSGAETSLQVFTVFKEVLDSLKLHDPTYKDLKIKYNFLSLPNTIPVLAETERVKNLYEPLAPALGILNSTNGNTLKADTIIRYLAQKNNWNYFSIHPRVKKIKVANVWPVLPLGWQISDYALEQMILSISDRQSPIYTILKEFPMYQAPGKDTVKACH